MVFFGKNTSESAYVSFSGGKDSTVLLYIARRLYPDIPAVYCDTGLEYPEIREFVKTVDNVTWIKPVRWDRHKQQYVPTNFKEVLQTYGYPVASKEVSQHVYEYRHQNLSDEFRTKLLYGSNGNNGWIPRRWHCLLNAPFEVSHKCCDAMKKHPFARYERETGRHGIVATMADESRLRKQTWLRYGCNAFDAKRPISKPMSFWLQEDVLDYIKTFDVPYCKAVYGDIIEDESGHLKTTGCDRTGCMFCMFGCHMEPEPNKFQKMRETHPSVYNYCMKPLTEGGLGLDDILNYIKVPH